MSVYSAAHTLSVSNRMEYREAEKRICIRAVNYEHNREMASDLPCVRREDLAILFFYIPEHIPEEPGEEEETMTSPSVRPVPQPITGEDLLRWNIDVFRLFRDASVASAQVHPAFLAPMRLLLGLPQELEEGEIPMYVLSSRDARFGASVMFYPGLLSEIAGGLGDDLYIIPSSIHELILLRAQDVDDTDSLSRMIREINRTEVAPGEVLSDSLYFYSRETDDIHRAPESLLPM